LFWRLSWWFFFQSETRYLDGVCHRTYCPWNTDISSMDTGLEELVRLKLGLTMLCSVIPKKTLVFSQLNLLFLLRSVNRWNWIWFGKRFTKKCAKLENVVRLGPKYGSIVEEAVSRSIPWIRLGTNSLVQLGHGINQMRFQATITCKTSSIAVTWLAQGINKKNARYGFDSGCHWKYLWTKI
jgi:hypothetical protein